MKVLFLDVDGVLNCDSTKERCNGFVGVDRRLSAKLVKWLERNDGVEIVLSSTWRHVTAFAPDAHSHLRAAGITWVAQTGRGPSRGDEIDQFLKDRKDLGITAFAILDDVSVLDKHKDFHVQTDPRHGLQDHHLDQLDAIFKRQAVDPQA